VAAHAYDGAAPATRWERLLDLDRDLAEALGDDVASRARDRIGAATVRLEQGSWQPQSLEAAVHDAFALLVCEGLVVRELDLVGTLTADLIGPGDVIAFGQPPERLLATHVRWHVSGFATLAILDRRVLPALHAVPALGARLIERVARQAARAAEQRAISQLPRVELRIRALLWHLAERWGRVGASGVVVPIDLTHSALGHLVGSRRSTVTLALGELSRLGMVGRRDDGAWVLRADSNPSAVTSIGAVAPGIAAIGELAPGIAAIGELALRIAAIGTSCGAQPGRSPGAPASARDDSAALADRIARLRSACVREHARSVELLARCEARRGDRADGRDGRLSPPPAAAAPP